MEGKIWLKLAKKELEIESRRQAIKEKNEKWEWHMSQSGPKAAKEKKRV